MAMDNWPQGNKETKESGESRLEIYSRDDRLGTGWCMSLFVRDTEVMRFDLFRPAHEHWNMETLNSPRMFFPELEWKERVELAVNNLKQHYHIASALCRDETVRGYEIQDLEEMSQWANEVLKGKEQWTD